MLKYNKSQKKKIFQKADLDLSILNADASGSYSNSTLTHDQLV